MQMAGLLYIFGVCLFVGLFVHPHLSRAQYVTSYVIMQLQYMAAFGGLQVKLQQTNEGSLCVVLQLQLAWPELCCVYCMGNVPGWFFRHECQTCFNFITVNGHYLLMPTFPTFSLYLGSTYTAPLFQLCFPTWVVYNVHVRCPQELPQTT